MHFKDIVCVIHGNEVQGNLTVETSGFKWEARSSTVSHVNVKASDIKSMTWFRAFRGYCVRIVKSDKTVVRYELFRKDDMDKLTDVLGIPIDAKSISTKGLNFGDVKVEGPVLSFFVDEKRSFDVDLKTVSQCQTKGNELLFEFHQNEDEGMTEMLEMRLVIPAPLEDEPPRAEALREEIMKTAQIETSSNDAIAVFEDVGILVPRGKYDIELFATYMKLRGKTWDFTIPYQRVMRMFHFPRPEKANINFVISVDPPIRQGTTAYPHLVLQFTTQEETELKVELEEGIMEKKYNGVLKPTMEGLTHDVFTTVIKALSGKRVSMTGNFISATQAHAVRCSHKAEEGYLYPMNNCFFFIIRPPVYIQNETIVSFEFLRVSSRDNPTGTSSRTFDMIINCRGDSKHQFTNIQRTEYTALVEWIKSKNLKIKTVEKIEDGPNIDALAGLSDSDDNGPRKRPREKGAAPMEGESSEDDDYVASDKDSGAEEYDSNPPTASSSENSDEDEETKAKKKAKKEKAKAKAEKRAKKEQKKLMKQKRKREEAGEEEDGDSDDAPAAKSKKSKSKDTPEKGKKKKAKKDPNAPKRPMSAFFLFMNAERPKIKERDPTVAVKDIGIIGGKLWKEMDDEAKAPWMKLQEEAKAAYAIALKEYKAKGGEAVKEEDNDAEDAGDDE